MTPGPRYCVQSGWCTRPLACLTYNLLTAITLVLPPSLLIIGRDSVNKRKKGAVRNQYPLPDSRRVDLLAGDEFVEQSFGDAQEAGGLAPGVEQPGLFAYHVPENTGC